VGASPLSYPAAAFPRSSLRPILTPADCVTISPCVIQEVVARSHRRRPEFVEQQHDCTLLSLRHHYAYDRAGPHFLRKPYGPGWALVGDAGCHKDPYLALGICDAFRDAEWLSDAIDDGLSGRRSVDTAMAEYERRRNEATIADYKQNLELAQFKPIPAEVSQLRLALRGNQEDTNRFYLAREGMIPPETFFTSENLKRPMGTVMDQSR
jgi:2-polyprenyl-6-methoxyphenol hydroxylase-like FAD-dependent oxidoreductase